MPWLASFTAYTPHQVKGGWANIGVGVCVVVEVGIAAGIRASCCCCCRASIPCICTHSNHHPPTQAENSLAKFGGPGAVELHAAVEAAVAAGRFRHPPLLVGAHLSLSDDGWGTAVEAAIGRHFDTWVVDNHADAAVLKVRTAC